MQQRRAIVFFGLALVLAFGAVLAARQILERPVVVAGPAVVETSPVVVARGDIQTGSALTARQLDIVQWPTEFLPKASFRQESDLEGRVLRRALAAGEPVLEPTLMPEGSQAGLVSVIEDKRRAVSVKVDPVIGVAGFVTPGSRVDVLATLRRVDLTNKIPYSKVILQDVPVLAIDQQLEDSRTGDPEIVNVVTLEVSPEDAEKLIYGAHEGRLQLALRSPADRELVKTASIGVADLLATRRKASPPRAVGPSVEVLTGATRSVKQF
jgi:pilus assembly protein CpaB